MISAYVPRITFQNLIFFIYYCLIVVVASTTPLITGIGIYLGLDYVIDANEYIYFISLGVSILVIFLVYVFYHSDVIVYAYYGAFYFLRSLTYSLFNKSYFEKSVVVKVNWQEGEDKKKYKEYFSNGILITDFFTYQVTLLRDEKIQAESLFLTYPEYDIYVDLTTVQDKDFSDLEGNFKMQLIDKQGLIVQKIKILSSLKAESYIYSKKKKKKK